MKKVIMLLVAAALTVTACKKTGNTEGETTDSTSVATDGEGIEGEGTEGETTEDATSIDTVAVSTIGADFAEGSAEKSILDFVNGGEAGTKTFVLDQFAVVESGEEGADDAISAGAETQLKNIAAILAANPELGAEIQAHGRDVALVKAGTTARANAIKAKLVLFEDFKGEQLTAKGFGKDQLLEGVDGKDASQKRIVMAITKK